MQPQLTLDTQCISSAAVFIDLSEASNGVQYTCTGISLVAPVRDGSASIVSSDAEHPPFIDIDHLTRPLDKETAIAAFKRARQVCAAWGFNR
ncbi:hypothetical protein BDW68DRAFT_108964 [Aspergillus falconensis]